MTSPLRASPRAVSEGWSLVLEQSKEVKTRQGQEWTRRAMCTVLELLTWAQRESKIHSSCKGAHAYMLGSPRICTHRHVHLLKHTDTV